MTDPADPAAPSPEPVPETTEPSAPPEPAAAPPAAPPTPPIAPEFTLQDVRDWFVALEQRVEKTERKLLTYAPHWK